MLQTGSPQCSTSAVDTNPWYVFWMLLSHLSNIKHVNGSKIDQLLKIDQCMKKKKKPCCCFVIHRDLSFPYAWARSVFCLSETSKQTLALDLSLSCLEGCIIYILHDMIHFHGKFRSKLKKKDFKSSQGQPKLHIWKSVPRTADKFTAPWQQHFNLKQFDDQDNLCSFCWSLYFTASD